MGLTQSVEVNDLLFVTHAVVITCVIIYQCYLYKLKSHNLNRWHLALVVIFWILLIYNLILSAAGILPFVNKSTSYRYSVIEYLGYVKVCISFVKYCPQAYMNWSRQSTVGWSVGNVLLDLTGGLLAFGQQGLEAYRKNDTSEFTSNIAKLLLSCESVAFDLLFIVQHYILYRGNNSIAEQTASLTKEEQEALEAETQARARANVAVFVPKSLIKVVTSSTAAGDDEANTTKADYQSVSDDPSHHLNPSVNRSSSPLIDPNDNTSVDMNHLVRNEDHRTKLLNQRRDSSSQY